MRKDNFAAYVRIFVPRSFSDKGNYGPRTIWVFSMFIEVIT
jgi:hypothetical protein